MSSTGRPKKDGTKTPKRDKEFYATPIPAIFQLLDQPEIKELVRSKDFFYEPAAGIMILT